MEISTTLLTSMLSLAAMAAADFLVVFAIFRSDNRTAEDISLANCWMAIGMMHFLFCGFWSGCFLFLPFCQFRSIRAHDFQLGNGIFRCLAGQFGFNSGYFCGFSGSCLCLDQDN